MTFRKYILGGRDGHTPVPLGPDQPKLEPGRMYVDVSYLGSAQANEDLMTWAKFMEGADRRVAQDSIWGVEVSTVFLGLDHGWDEREPPILFETMVFGGVLGDIQCRYCTWDEAAAGHAATLRRVRALAIPSFFFELYRASAKLLSDVLQILKSRMAKK